MTLDEVLREMHEVACDRFHDSTSSYTVDQWLTVLRENITWLRKRAQKLQVVEEAIYELD